MASLLLTPSYTGADVLDLLSSTYHLQREGSIDTILPAVEYDEEYAESIDSEGGLPIRSRPQNKNGGGRLTVNVSGNWSNVRTWERTVELVRRYGGTFDYTPDDGQTVTYDLLSMRTSAIPQDMALLHGADVVVPEFTFTCRPYGRLPRQNLVANANGTDALLTFDVPAPGGSVDALGILTLTDLASQARLFAEGGLESPGRVDDLLLSQPDMFALDAASSTTSAGSYSTNVWRQTLATTSKGVAYTAGAWTGKYVVKARVRDSAGPVGVRLGYAIRGNTPFLNPWVTLPQNANWTEVNLGVMFIDPALVGGQSVQLSVYGKAVSGTPTLDLDYLKVIPAKAYFKARGGVGAGATIRSGRYLNWAYNAVLTETANGVWTQHPNSVGKYLLIPADGGRLTVFANRADIETAVANNVSGDGLRADLDVIPRVALVGA